MKKLLLFWMCLLSVVTASALDGTKPSGSGTESSPFIITTADEYLYVTDYIKVERQFDCYVKLGNDIDLNSIASNGSTPHLASVKSFDGQGYSIWGFQGTHMGFIGQLSEGGTVSNLSLKGCELKFPDNGTVGYGVLISDASKGGTVTGCTVQGSYVEVTNGYLGGIVGLGPQNDTYSLVIHDCVNNNRLYGVDAVGGILGRGTANIYRCANLTDIHGTGKGVGGIVGSGTNCTISNCAQISGIKGSSRVGGIIGESFGTLIIRNCMMARGYLTQGDNGVESTACGLLFGWSRPVGADRFVNITDCAINGSRVGLANNFTVPRDNDYYGMLINDSGSEVTLGEVASYTDEDLQSGKAAFELQGSQHGTQWGMTIGTDEYPLPMTQNQVYQDRVKNCLGEISVLGYTNDSSAPRELGHEYHNGICELCTASNPVSAEGGVYLIYNAGHLLSFARDFSEGKLTSHDLRLMADIDLSTWCHPAQPLAGLEERSWQPIGYVSKDVNEKCYNSYFGTFDGNNHSISGLYISSPTVNNIGAYGLVAYADCSTFKDLTISGDISGVQGNVGMLVGMAQNTNFENISTQGDIEIAYDKNNRGNIGGVVGQLEDGDSQAGFKKHNIIKNCHNYTNIQTDGYNYVGGIVGVASYSYDQYFHLTYPVTIEQCTNHGNLTSRSHLGGIAGRIRNYHASLVNLANYGTVRTNELSCGGIIGEIPSDVSDFTFRNLLNCGDILDASAFPQSYPICPLSTALKDPVGLYYDSSKTYCTPTFIPSKTYLGTPVTPAQLASGEVTYLLNDKKSDASVVWRQRVDTDPVQPMPRLSGSIVYEVMYKNCQGQAIADHVFYSNDRRTDRVFHGDGHVYAETTGHCKYCSDDCAPELDAEDYYLLSCLEDLLWFRAQVKNGNVAYKARLTADIDLSSVCGQTLGKSWTPIESMSTAAYSGTFDGQGHKISGLYIYGLSNDLNGLFGDVSGKICNLSVEGNITANDYCGLIAAKITVAGARIENCKAYGQINGGSCIGGIVGGGTGHIVNCENLAHVIGYEKVGGIVGGFVSNTSGEIQRCVNKGHIEGTRGGGYSAYVGGLAGHISAQRQAFLVNSASVGNVNASLGVGGLVGGVEGKTLVISGSWFCGELKEATQDDETVGLLVGDVPSTTTVNCSNSFYKNAYGNYSSEYGIYMFEQDFKYGTVAARLGAPWGQNVDYDETQRDLYPVLDGMPIFGTSPYYYDATNISIGLIPYLVKKAREEGKYTKQDIDIFVDRLSKKQ